ncbi:MAG: hypothetical protein SGCHY_002971 [Lobulomycetales sp.]
MRHPPDPLEASREQSSAKTQKMYTSFTSIPGHLLRDLAVRADLDALDPRRRLQVKSDKCGAELAKAVSATEACVHAVKDMHGSVADLRDINKMLDLV